MVRQKFTGFYPEVMQSHPTLDTSCRYFTGMKTGIQYLQVFAGIEKVDFSYLQNLDCIPGKYNTWRVFLSFCRYLQWVFLVPVKTANLDFFAGICKKKSNTWKKSGIFKIKQVENREKKTTWKKLKNHLILQVLPYLENIYNFYRYYSS